MTGHPPLPLRTGPGWKETRPRETGHRIAWESKGAIRFSSTDFKEIVSSASVGPVESPLAFESQSGLLYRYACPDWSGRRSLNGILGIDPATGNSANIFPLHPLRWVPWMLQAVAGKPLLLGLVVTDASRSDRPGIVLHHQIGLFHTSGRKSLLRNLPVGCRHPVGVDPARDLILFHGPDGYQLVDSKGRRKLLLSDPAWGDGRFGAAFRPGSEEILIGGAELSSLRPSKPKRQALCQNAYQPSWIDGQRILYGENSGSLSLLEKDGGHHGEIVSIAGNRHPELKMARPAQISPDGRFFALPLTRRAPLHSDVAGKDRSHWTEHQTLVVGDLEKREIWQHPGPVEQCAWAGL